MNQITPEGDTQGFYTPGTQTREAVPVAGRALPAWPHERIVRLWPKAAHPRNEIVGPSAAEAEIRREKRQAHRNQRQHDQQQRRGEHKRRPSL
jgi:hypothetical protein